MCMDLPNVKSIWDRLRQRFQAQGEQLQLMHYDELSNVKMTRGESVSHYLSRAIALQQLCINAGCNVTEAEVIHYALRGITRTDLQQTVTCLRCRDNLTLQDLERHLLTATSTPPQANLYYDFASPNEYCGGLGDYFNTPRSGIHETTAQTRPIPRASERAATPTQNEPPRCAWCGRMNHTEPQCHQKRRYLGEQKSTQTTTGKTPTAQQIQHKRADEYDPAICAEDQQEEEYETEQAAYSVQHISHSNFTIGKKVTKQDKWYLDSGASTHLTTNSTWLFNPIPIHMHIGLGGKGKTVTATLRGDVKLITLYGQITLKDVLYSEEAVGNLISTVHLDRTGFHIVQGNSKMTLFGQKRDIIAEATLQTHDCYELQATPKYPVTDKKKRVERERTMGYLPLDLTTWTLPHSHTIQFDRITPAGRGVLPKHILPAEVLGEHDSFVRNPRGPQIIPPAVPPGYPLPPDPDPIPPPVSGSRRGIVGDNACGHSVVTQPMTLRSDRYFGANIPKLSKLRYTDKCDKKVSFIQQIKQPSTPQSFYDAATLPVPEQSQCVKTVAKRGKVKFKPLNNKR